MGFEAVELPVSIKIDTSNLEQFSALLSQTAESDIVINTKGVEKTLGSISKQLLDIINQGGNVEKKLNNALEGSVDGLTTGLNAYFKRLTTGVNDTYAKLQEAQKKGNIFDISSLKNQLASELRIMQDFMRTYSDNIGSLADVRIGENLYDERKLTSFIFDLEKESSKENESTKEKLKKEK